MFTLKDKNDLIQWIRDWFYSNGEHCNAIVGISGGKDSAIVAKLCVEALGRDRVFGVLMPNGEQKDIADAFAVVSYLGINYTVVNIEKTYYDVTSNARIAVRWLDSPGLSVQTKINVASRIRMTTLYAISQSLNRRVANTSNLSERYMGYFTKWGDEGGDFAPLANLTSTEVVQLGDLLGLPEHLVHKAPADGLTEMTDEEFMGVKYEEIDDVIRNGGMATGAYSQKEIMRRHGANRFKTQPIASFPYEVKNNI